MKPEGWLDDEPLTIPDPGKSYSALTSTKPSSKFYFCHDQTLRSPKNGMTRKTVIGLHLLSLTPSVPKLLAVVNGLRELSSL